MVGADHGAGARNREVRRLLAMLEATSPGEAAHAQRVAVYAVATADRLGIGGEELATVRDAALLHDVGKVQLDAETVRKLGSLTEDELAEMRRHAEEAVAVIGSTPGLAGTLAGIRSHHERWDGSGYPDGLAGGGIPLAARIIGLAEAFDVMSFGAVWREPVPSLVAAEVVDAQAGLEWDPEVARAFLDVQPIIQPNGMPA